MSRADSVTMFTLEDIDLSDAKAVLESSGVHPTPDADVREHPTDYFIVGA